MTRKEIATELCRRFPDASSLGLSKKLYKENPGLFGTLDLARSMIRYARGARGGEKRHLATVPRVWTPPEINPFRLPQAIDITYPTYQTHEKTFFVFGDVHVPFHDVQSLTLAIQSAQKFNPEAILINGDLIDFHRCSEFVKELKGRSTKEELAMAYEFLTILRKTFKKATIYYKFGNHDERFDRYIRQCAPEVMDLPGMPLKEQQWIPGKKLADLGIEVIQDKMRVLIGKLPILHGHEWKGGISRPVNPARGAFLKAKDPCAVNHFHQSSEHSETSLNDKLVTCWSIGALCQLHPQYNPVNNWNHGFMMVEVDQEGAFSVQNKRIYKGEVW